MREKLCMFGSDMSMVKITLRGEQGTVTQLPLERFSWNFTRRTLQPCTTWLWSATRDGCNRSVTRGTSL